MIYIIATPIGNLGDISLRALETLKEVDIVVCEDTRNTSVLLNHYDIKKKLLAMHEHNENKMSDELVILSKEGKNIAVVSDAGMPGISDPGSRLINRLIEEGVEYTVLPGPSAFTTALVYSGLNSEIFKFIGFLPVKGKDRRKKLDIIKNEKSTVLMYEAPHKLDNTMKDLIEIIPERKISLVRELTKIFEEHVDFTCKDYFDQDFVKKGEMVIVIGPDETIDEMSDEEIISKLEILVKKGYKKSQAVTELVNEYDLSKNHVYRLSKTI